MRLLRALIALLCLLLGLVLGVLNADPATVDLGLIEVRAGLGVILLCTLLAGVLLGGLAIAVSVALPLRRALTRARDESPAHAAAASPSTLPES
jgi:putative membrane protein